jgi:hypothetical protein
LPTWTWLNAPARGDPAGHRFAQAQKLRLRRLWVSVEQKTQVIARAFLTQHGFHHTATMKELLADQDALIYVRTFD